MHNKRRKYITGIVSIELFSDAIKHNRSLALYDFSDFLPKSFSGKFKKGLVLIINRLCMLIPGTIIIDRGVNNVKDVLISFCSKYEDRIIQIWDKNIDFGSVTFYKLKKDGNIYRIDIQKPELDYFEYHISWHCNLNCKGCGHYSNLQKEPRFADLVSYRNDINRLNELYRNITTIRLMGGEPLLNKELPEFIKVTREAFPHADIHVTTNGLLIPYSPQNLLEVMRENDAIFDCTLYEPTKKILDKIKKRCTDSRVNIDFWREKGEFVVPVNGSHKGNVKENYEACGSRVCHFLYNGEMAACGLPIFNREMKDKIKWVGDFCEEDIINIYDKDLDGYKLNSFLNRPLKTCAYCNLNEKKTIKWEGYYTEYICSEMI